MLTNLVLLLNDDCDLNLLSMVFSDVFLLRVTSGLQKRDGIESRGKVQGHSPHP